MKIWLTILLFFFISCSNSSYEKNMAFSLSFYENLAHRIFEDYIHVFSLIHTGDDPEQFDLSVKDMQQLKKAQSYLAIGVFPFEDQILKQRSSFLDGKFSSLFFNDLLLQYEKGMSPHFFFSLKRLPLQINMITKKGSLILPEKKDLFYQNQKTLLHEVNILDQQFSTLFEKFHNRSIAIIQTHPWLDYFALDYQIPYFALFKEGIDPSVHDFEHLKEKLASHQKIILITLSPELSHEEQILKQNLKCQTIVFDPYSKGFIEGFKNLLHDLKAI